MADIGDIAVERVGAQTTAAGLFALLGVLERLGIVKREQAGQVLDAMIDTVMGSALPLEQQQALLLNLQKHWEHVAFTVPSAD